jgi:hypothetical protein
MIIIDCRLRTLPLWLWWFAIEAVRSLRVSEVHHG